MRLTKLTLSCSAVLCIGLAASLTATAADFPTKGTYALTAGGATWSATFMADGKLTVNRNGQLAVEATYKVNKDEVEFKDVKGPNADPNAKAGKYKWKLDGKKLTFTKVEDPSEGRAGVVTAGDWVKED